MYFLRLPSAAEAASVSSLLKVEPAHFKLVFSSSSSIFVEKGGGGGGGDHRRRPESSRFGPLYCLRVLFKTFPLVCLSRTACLEEREKERERALLGNFRP